MNIENALIVLEALQLGEELEVNGRTYVWLDNHITKTVNGVDYGIDGLAIKGESFKGIPMVPGTGEVHYMGSDMGLNFFIELCEDLPKDTIERLGWTVASSKALTKLVKKR